MSKSRRRSDPIEKLEVGVVRIFSFIGFIVIVADAAITHIYPYLKHLWYVIFSP